MASPHPDHGISPDCLARGIEAIETNPADSLVSSYRCKCGGEIRQYENRVEGKCCCASRKQTLESESEHPEVPLAGGNGRLEGLYKPQATCSKGDHHATS